MVDSLQLQGPHNPEFLGVGRRGDHDHYRFLTEAFRLFAHANVLQRDMYPSTAKLEAEIVAMTAAMLHADAVPGHHPGEQVCGVVTFGGTESLINPMLVYRDRGRAEKGITRLRWRSRRSIRQAPAGSEVVPTEAPARRLPKSAIGWVVLNGPKR